MKTNSDTDFEGWAKLLIDRKVPDRYGHLIDPQMIRSGADILKQGGAFEIQIDPPDTDESTRRSAAMPARIQIVIRPIVGGPARTVLVELRRSIRP